MEEINDRLNRFEAELSGVRAELVSTDYIMRIVKLEAKLSALGQHVRSRNVEVVDEDGNTRATLKEDGLRVRDQKGRTRAALALTAAGPMVALFDEKVNRVGLSALASGPLLALMDEKGNSRATISVFSSEPELTLFDERGERKGEAIDSNAWLKRNWPTLAIIVILVLCWAFRYRYYTTSSGGNGASLYRVNVWTGETCFKPSARDWYCPKPE